VDKQSLCALVAVAGAVAITTSVSVRADDITIDGSRFVSSKSRSEVIADLKTPYSGGNPWSSQYKMGVAKSDRTPQDVRREYLASRDEADALGAEDSGSNYFKRSVRALNPTATMGAPAR
jgi:hypothetical protein